MLIRAMPVLQVADVTRSVAFYCEKLGFFSHGTWGEGPDFCIVQRGPATIALDRTRKAGSAVPLNQYWAAYVYVADDDKLCAEHRTKGVEVVRGLEDMEYGPRNFDIRDPDGHLTAFGHDQARRKGGPGLVADKEQFALREKRHPARLRRMTWYVGLAE